MEAVHRYEGTVNQVMGDGIMALFGASARPRGSRRAGVLCRAHDTGHRTALLEELRPGVELVLEAFDGYWRKTPAVKRLVFRSIPDESTRLAALKSGEVDIAYGAGRRVAAKVLDSR